MFLMTKIKTYIAQTMKLKNINIFEIDEQLETFSNDLHHKLIEDFLEYGVALKKFFVTTVVKPDGDVQYEKFKELHFRKYADVAEAKLKQEVDIIEQQTQSQKIIMESQAIAQKRVEEGYSYQQEKSFEVASHAAQNEGVGQFTNMGIGLGVMSGIGGNISGMVSGAVNGAFSNTTTQPQVKQKFCDNCGNELEQGVNFCDSCGVNQQKENSCVKCGFAFTKPGKFCPGCGQNRGV